MKVRTLLTFTAIFSSILGAVVAYLVLTVPNDLEAGAMLKQAHAQLQAGKSDEARDTLATVVQQHPRTDGAAAAIVALVRINDSEREKLELQLAVLRRENQQQTQLIGALQKSVAEIKSAPPKIVTVQAPAPKPAPKPAPPKKKSPPARRRR